MTSCFSCNCFFKKSFPNGTNGEKAEDNYENETYISVPPPPQLQADNNSSSRATFFKLSIFKSKPKNDASNSQSGEDVGDGAGTSRRSRKSKLWENGKKKSSVSGGPTYDYIDAEGGSFDAVYSRVDENPMSSQRYEYPAFLMNSRRRNAPELFYTSASQIYSAGSEDPYSSIISGDHARNNYDVESNSSVYDVGYARVQNGGSMSGKKTSLPRSMPRLPSTTARNIDSLYAKINRAKKLNTLVDVSSENSIGVTSKNAGTSAEMVHFSNGDVVTTTSPPLPTGTVDCLSSTSRENYGKSIVNGLKTLSYPIEESDSESMGSYYTGTGSSQNPSYRYLTVRESVDVIRERIRRQELEAANRTRQEDSAPGQREHYYSTIPNEYESVGEESSTPTTSSAVEEDRLRQQNIALRYSSPLSLSIITNQCNHHHHNFSPNNTIQRHRISDNISIAPELTVATSGVEPPPPPTSPIPNRCGDDASTRSPPPPVQQPPHPVTILRPVILSNASNTVSSRHSMVLMSTSAGGNGNCSGGGGSAGILTAPFNNIRNTAWFGKNESTSSSTHHLMNGNNHHSNGHTLMGPHYAQQSNTGSNVRLDRIEGVMPRLSAIIRGKHREITNAAANGLHHSSKRKSQPTAHLKHNSGQAGELSRQHGCTEDGGVPPPLPPLPTPCVANLALSKDFTEIVAAGGPMNGAPRTSFIVSQERDELTAAKASLISPTSRMLPLSSRLSGAGGGLIRSCTPSPTTVDVAMQASAGSSVVYRGDNQRGNTVEEASSGRKTENGQQMAGAE